MCRSSAPLRALVLLLAFSIVLIAGAYRFFANPQVPQGGSASFSATGSEVPASGTWDVLNPSGAPIANSGAANGWSVSLSGTTFPVGAPTSAPVAVTYKVRYGGAVVINPDARPAPTQKGGVTPQPAGGQSAPFDVIAGVVGPPPPPTGLTAVGGTAKTTLTWTASAGTTGYNLKRATTAGGPYATVATNVASPYTNTGLTNGTKYYFVVTATNSGGESGNSNEANATPIAVPTNVVATAGNAQVSLNWSAAGATGYKVKVGTTPGNYPTVVTSAGISATVTGLANGTTYYFVVTGTNTVGESDPSAQISATPSAPATPPVAPTNVSAVGGTAKATVSWTASPGATAYAVKYGTATGVYPNTVGSVTSPTTILGLTNGAKVYAVVVASNTAGSSPNSTEASATPIAVPTNVVATPGNGQATLAWSASAGATGYKVRFGTTSGGPYNGTATATGTPTTVVGLTNGTTYYFVVTGTNTVGESDPSAQVSSRPVPPPPAAPSGLTATAVSSSQVNLAWTDNATNETGYRVERKPGTTGAYAQIGTANANATSYQDTSGLSASTLYTYRVRATNAGGDSAYSNEAGSTTQAQNPSDGLLDAVAAATGLTKVTIYWHSVPGAYGYNIYRSLSESTGFTKINANPVNGNDPGPGVVAGRMYTDANLVSGNRYYYKVAVVQDGAGTEGAVSETVFDSPSQRAIPWDTGDAQMIVSKVNQDGANSVYGWDATGWTVAIGPNGVQYSSGVTVGPPTSTEQTARYDPVTSKVATSGLGLYPWLKEPSPLSGVLPNIEYDYGNAGDTGVFRKVEALPGYHRFSGIVYFPSETNGLHWDSGAGDTADIYGGGTTIQGAPRPQAMDVGFQKGSDTVQGWQIIAFYRKPNGSTGFLSEQKRANQPVEGVRVGGAASLSIQIPEQGPFGVPENTVVFTVNARDFGGVMYGSNKGVVNLRKQNKKIT